MQWLDLGQKKNQWLRLFRLFLYKVKNYVRHEMINECNDYILTGKLSINIYIQLKVS